MPFSVDQFKAQLGNPVKADNFEMSFATPKGMSKAIAPYLTDMNFKVEATELPGRAVRTVDHSHYGPIQKVATGITYQDFTASIICTNNMKEQRVFQGWLDLIVGDHRLRKGDANARFFDVNYYDNYKSSMSITQFNDSGQKINSVRFVDAFPILISPVALSWASNEIIKLNVTFTYRYFIDENRDAQKQRRDIPDTTRTIQTQDVINEQIQRRNEIINPGARSLSGLEDHGIEESPYGDAAA